MRHIKRWSALTRFTESGHLDASNNYAERCTRAVAVGGKGFLFVGSERAGHAVAIYYSLVESCRVNSVNPLTYLTYILSNARNRTVSCRRRMNLPNSEPPPPAAALFDNLE